MTTIRLMCYNIRSLRDDRAAVARVIRAAAPDVVCIQEAPRFLGWRTSHARLARHAGMVVVGGGRPAGSNLILSTLAVSVDAQFDVLLSKDRKLHQRGTAIAVLRKGATRFAVAGTHLDLEEQARLRHVSELDAALDARVPADVPVVLMGDINDLPGTPVWQALGARRRDAQAVVNPGDDATNATNGFTSFTWSAMDPHKRIDAMFVDPRLQVRSARALHSPDVAIASDHCPLLVEVDVEPGG